MNDTLDGTRLFYYDGLRVIEHGELDDAVMTSPGVVGRLVYVVDRMGTASCVERAANGRQPVR